MTTVSLRSALSGSDDRMDDGVRNGMAWSAHGSVRQWLSLQQVRWAPSSELARAVFMAGFLYDPTQDIIYTRKDAWQHAFGYCYGYDKFALAASFVIDCEPIFFRHGNKEWMIELWKGQYGLETGCEIGVYNRRDDDDGIEMQALDATIGRRDDGSGGIDTAHSRFYRCAEPDEYLRIALRLRRDGEVLFERGPERHWWLTGFKWGVLSPSDSLTVDVSIGFTDSGMRDAFVASLRQLGYANVRVSGASVQFVFDVPRTYQPRTADRALQDAVLAADGQLVQSYRALGLPNNDPNMIQGQVGTKVGGLVQPALKLGYDVFAAQLPELVEDVAEDIANRVTQFFEDVADGIEDFFN